MAKKIPQCSACGRSGHYKTFCPYTARTIPTAKKRYIKPVSDKAREKRIQTRDEWFNLNYPDTQDGRWFCYLDGLSEYCWKVLTKDEIISYGLEHTESKARHPESKYDVTKLRPACPPCNGIKGSLDIDDLLSMHEDWGGPRA